MKFLSLVLALIISTPVISAECTPVVEKKVEEKKVEKQAEGKSAEKPAKKKHKKYEGTKIPPK